MLWTNKTSEFVDALLGVLSPGVHEILNEKAFKRMIAVERKRTERSGDPFLLMLVVADGHQDSKRNERALNNISSVLSSSIRETDVIGWFKDQTTVGVIFTGLMRSDKNPILSAILSKVSSALKDQLSAEQFNQVSISFHFFPDDWNHDNPESPSNPTLYSDLLNPDEKTSSLLRAKLLMDIVGSSLALILCAPLFMAIALAIKLSSRGPVFFRQQRVGQYGRCFTFLKFRSMQVDNDHGVHKNYVTKLISGEIELEALNRNHKCLYKLTNDQRVTGFGRFLRRTSLDELPQLINVLKGDMSLVGPRPAIPYELAAYQTWHRRRVLGVKPGITGLWQVTGRSRVKFDEMIRLDLRYATATSLWLDLVILMRTPLAVIRGAGAV